MLSTIGIKAVFYKFEQGEICGKSFRSRECRLKTLFANWTIQYFRRIFLLEDVLEALQAEVMVAGVEDLWDVEVQVIVMMTG